jgi:hypothetical protein
MMTLEAVELFLGWGIVINSGVMLFSFLAIAIFNKSVVGIHSKLFSLSKEDLDRAYFQYWGQYKILIIFFNIVPYVTLKLAF